MDRGYYLRYLDQRADFWLELTGGDAVPILAPWPLPITNVYDDAAPLCYLFDCRALHWAELRGIIGELAGRDRVPPAALWRQVREWSIPIVAAGTELVLERPPRRAELAALPAWLRDLTHCLYGPDWVEAAPASVGVPLGDSPPRAV